MKIMVVDDHPLCLEGMRLILDKLGSNVELLIAHSCTTAVDLMDAHSDVNLILLDLRLPDADGFTLMTASFERIPQAPVVILFASTRRSDMQQALAAGAKGFICKSSPPSVVLNALNLVLAGGIYTPGDDTGIPAHGGKKPWA